MTLVLDLPPELETKLAAEAARLRLPLAEYAMRLLESGGSLESLPRTGAALVAYWQSKGLIGTRPDITDAPSHARALRGQAEKRERAEEMDLVDTDVVIDVQRGHPTAVAWFSGLAELPAIPGIVVMELIQNARNAREVQQALELVAPLPVVWPTEADCARGLSEFAASHLAHGLGLLDALIAACAVGRTARLLTFNVRHFRVITGLVTAEPYSR